MKTDLEGQVFDKLFFHLHHSFLKLFHHFISDLRLNHRRSNLTLHQLNVPINLQELYLSSVFAILQRKAVD